MGVLGLFFWVIIWGGACAILANNKGRNWFGWFILGALFSLIALLVLGFLDKRETNQLRADADGRPFHPALPTVATPVSGKFLADLIAMLERDQGATISDMCHELKVHPDVVTKAIEGLRRRGLLIRAGSGISPRFSLPKTRIPRNRL